MAARALRVAQATQEATILGFRALVREGVDLRQNLQALQGQAGDILPQLREVVGGMAGEQAGLRTQVQGALGAVEAAFGALQAQVNGWIGKLQALEAATQGQLDRMRGRVEELESQEPQAMWARLEQLELEMHEVCQLVDGLEPWAGEGGRDLAAFMATAPGSLQTLAERVGAIEERGGISGSLPRGWWELRT